MRSHFDYFYEIMAKIVFTYVNYNILYTLSYNECRSKKLTGLSMFC